MSLTGYLYILQVICTVQITCLVHIYEPIELLAISMYISNTVSVLFSNTFVSLTGYLYTLQVICTIQVTCLVHMSLTGYLYIFVPVCLKVISVLFSNTFVSLYRLFVQYK